MRMTMGWSSAFRTLILQLLRPPRPCYINCRMKGDLFRSSSLFFLLMILFYYNYFPRRGQKNKISEKLASIVERSAIEWINLGVKNYIVFPFNRGGRKRERLRFIKTVLTKGVTEYIYKKKNWESCRDMIEWDCILLVYTGTGCWVIIEHNEFYGWSCFEDNKGGWI